MVTRTGRLILIGLAVLTFYRATAWENNLTLWGRAVDETPYNPRAWINYGVAWEVAGNNWQATRAFHYAIVGATQPTLPRSPYSVQLTIALAETHLAFLAMMNGDRSAALAYLADVRQTAPLFRPAADLEATWKVTP